jgi:hypothetical protein
MMIMDPERHRLDKSPRALNADAFFTSDRSITTVNRTVEQIELDANGKDRKGVPPTVVSFTGFQNRHAVTSLTEPNPLPHARKTDPGKSGVIDRTISGWNHNVAYTGFFSQQARTLSATALNQPRLQVKLLFGTGSEYFRLGVCGTVEASPQPTLLIIVPGIEPRYKIKFFNPANPIQKQELKANNQWGVGIRSATIEKIISAQYGRVISYDISVCAAYSTGYLGLQGSIEANFFPIDRLERVILFDCLYGTLKPTLDRVKSMKSRTQIIAYVVTGGGNSFRDKPEKFDDLVLGRVPGWNYINLMGNTRYHAIASARLIDEARSPAARILDSLPKAYETALNQLVAKLPARNTVISNAALFRKIKGNVPAGAVALADFTAKYESMLENFFRHATTTRHCLERAQLLGWKTPPGEEWHDMLLLEFAWEYLT